MLTAADCYAIAKANYSAAITAWLADVPGSDGKLQRAKRELEEAEARRPPPYDDRDASCQGRREAGKRRMRAAAGEDRGSDG